MCFRQPSFHWWWLCFFVVNHPDNDDSDVYYDLFLSTIISMMMLVMLFRPSFPSALDGGGCQRQSEVMMIVNMIALGELHSYTYKDLSTTHWVSFKVSQSVRHQWHLTRSPLFQYIKAWMPSSDPITHSDSVPPSTNHCCPILTTFTILHSFIASYRTVEPTGSSYDLIMTLLMMKDVVRGSLTYEMSWRK